MPQAVKLLEKADSQPLNCLCLARRCVSLQCRPFLWHCGRMVLLFLLWVCQISCRSRCDIWIRDIRNPPSMGQRKTLFDHSIRFLFMASTISEGKPVLRAHSFIWALVRSMILLISDLDAFPVINLLMKFWT